MTDIFRRHGAVFDAANALTPGQVKVLRALMVCRSAALGGHLEICDCGFERPVYNSCRNRHCPGCQSFAQRKWIEERLDRVLPTHHFHVVFTVPAELRPIAYRNRAVVYGIFMRAAAEVLRTLGEQRLEATLGITEVLHTWTREMLLHPHVHCVVTGGGLSLDGTRWAATPRHFLFPVAVMRRLFRTVVRRELLRAFQKGKLAFDGATAALADVTPFRRLLRGIRRKEWVVHCKEPFAGPKHVFEYLGRYTHRVAISDQRLLAVSDTAVTFRTRGAGVITVKPAEFMRRFLLHVLPDRFHKIRHFGLYASSATNGRLDVAASLLGPPAPAPPEVTAETDGAEDVVSEPIDIDQRHCPVCKHGLLQRVPLSFARPRSPPEPLNSS